MVIFLEERIQFDGIKLRKIREGKTEIFVPDPKEYVKDKAEYLPAALPVFYNPMMEINRDITLLSIYAYLNTFAAYAENIYLEALAGTGIRGFRIVREIHNSDITVILNDINPVATRLMQFNIERLSFPKNRVRIYNEDANFLFLKLKKEKIRPNIIEIDPYGTPAPFLFNALNLISGREDLLIITATDTAPLTGKYPYAALRKYGVRSVKNPFSREIALRFLLYTIGREAAILSKRAIPLFGVFLHHFIKVILLVKRGKTEANKFWGSVGWVSFCPICHEFYMSRKIYNFPPTSCKFSTHGSTEILGPTWIGTIFNREFAEHMLTALNKIDINQKNARILRKIIEWDAFNDDLLFYYDIEEIARRLKTSVPKIEDVISVLMKNGFRASRTHFNPKGIKTNAKIEKLVEAVRKFQ